MHPADRDSSALARGHPAAQGGQPQRRAAASAGLGLALLSAASFGTSGSFARSLDAIGWTPAAAAAARITGGALLLLVPTVMALRGHWPAFRRAAGLLTVYGVVVVAGGQVCFFNAIEHLPVGVAILIEYLGTALVVGWMWLHRGHRPRRPTVIGAVVAILGLVLVLDLTREHHLAVSGVVWALGGALALAVFFVVAADHASDLPAIGFAGSGLIVGAAAVFALGGIGALPIEARLAPAVLCGHRVSWLVPVGGLAVIAAAVAYIAGIGAARLLGPTLASFVSLTEALFGLLFAWLLLGELPTATQLLGGALIVGGVALVRADELGRARLAPPTRAQAAHASAR
jgi:drug/metabolite transporter (DMT)-like permease